MELDQQTSIINKTDYNRKKPDLKRHYNQEWGRFLDNHYDPNIHQKPFTIAMKAPDKKYRYSKGVGLSYKFNTPKVLERLDVEEQNQNKVGFVRFEEFNQIKDGQVMVSIEHCVNCADHSTTTKHDEQKYKMFGLHLQASIKEQFPLVQVIVKPISTDQDEAVKHLKVNPSSDKPTIIDHQIKETRIGAFEVQIYCKSAGRILEKVIFSKLKSNVWPSIYRVLEKIHFYLPRVPKVSVTLFKENHPHMVTADEDDQDVVFKNFEVKLNSNYQGTSSQNQLNQFLAQQNEEKLVSQIVARERREQRSQLLIRPGSAKTSIGQSRPDVLAQVSLFRKSNQVYQKNFQSYTALPQVRPMSSSTLDPQLQSNERRTFLGQGATINSLQNDKMTSHMSRRRPQSAFTNFSQGTARTRPFSAQTKSQKTQAKQRLTGRGQGFFGDSSDKIIEQQTKQYQEANLKVKTESKMTDENSCVSFQNVPVGKYTVEVAGNEEFQATSKIISLINEDNEDEVSLFVAIKPRIDSDIEFEFLKVVGEQSQPQDFAKLEAKAILLPDAQRANEQGDMEEHEFEIVWHKEKNLWVTTLMTGVYLINVKARGYKELNELIQVQPGQKNSHYFTMEENDRNVPNVVIEAVSAVTGKPIKSVYFELFRENLQQQEEGLSNSQGQFVYKVKDLGVHTVTAMKVGYVPVVKKINFTKQFLQSRDDGVYQIVVPMVIIGQQDVECAFVVLSADMNAEHLELLVDAGEQEMLPVQTFGNCQVCKVDMSQMSKFSLEESPQKGEDAQKALPFVRLMVRFKDHARDLLALPITQVDRHFKTPAQSSNISVSLYYMSPDEFLSVTTKVFEPPSYSFGNSIWDIGFFCAPFMIQTGILEKNVPGRLDDFAYHKKLQVFFANRKHQKFNQLLGKYLSSDLYFVGFDSDGVYRMDDTFLDINTFCRNLDAILGDKLYSHDQKKMIQKVNMGKEPEVKLGQIRQELMMFYSKFGSSLLNPFGFISYKKLLEHIDRI